MSAATPETSARPTVAIYWDFENIHASLVDERGGDGSYHQSRFASQEPVVDVAAVLRFAGGLGPVTINRAYANWQWFGRYRIALQDQAVELVQLFPVGGAKNGADIRLAVDVVDDLHRFAHVTDVLIVGGDSDFVPLAQHVRRLGRRVTAVGTPRATSGRLIAAVDTFRYYATLLSPPTAPELVATTVAVGCSSMATMDAGEGGAQRDGGGAGDHLDEGQAPPAPTRSSLGLAELAAVATGPGVGAGKVVSVPAAVAAAAEVFGAQETFSSWEELSAAVAVALSGVVADPAGAARVVKSFLYRTRQFRLLADHGGIRLAAAPDFLWDRVVDSLVERVRAHTDDVDSDALAALWGGTEEEVALLAFELRLRLLASPTLAATEPSAVLAVA